MLFKTQDTLFIIYYTVGDVRLKYKLKCRHERGLNNNKN